MFRTSKAIALITAVLLTLVVTSSASARHYRSRGSVSVGGVHINYGGGRTSVSVGSRVNVNAGPRVHVNAGPNININTAPRANYYRSAYAPYYRNYYRGR
jgi:hypothetical protein